MQRIEPQLCIFTLTIPLAEALRSLFMRRMRQAPYMLFKPYDLMLGELPAVRVPDQMLGWSLRARVAKRMPQKMGVGQKPGPGPKRDWQFGPVKKLWNWMKLPPREAKDIAVSRAQMAAAKVLVTPSTPSPLTNLISLMPTQQVLTISMRSPEPSTNLLLRYCSLQYSLMRLAMVASERFLKTMQRKVKEAQYYLIVLSSLIQLVSASQVMPGPLMKGGKNLLEMMERSFRQSAIPQGVPQMLLARSPQSISQRFTAAAPNKLKKALKLLKQVDFEKFLFQMSKPTSTEPYALMLVTNLVKVEVQLLFRMRSLVQVTVPPQIVEEQLYLYPRGTWKEWLKMLPIQPPYTVIFDLERRMGLLAQGRNYGRSQDIPTVLLSLQQRLTGEVRQSTVERKEELASVPKRRWRSMRRGRLKILVSCIQMQVGLQLRMILNQAHIQGGRDGENKWEKSLGYFLQYCVPLFIPTKQQILIR